MVSSVSIKSCASFAKASAQNEKKQNSSILVLNILIISTILDGIIFELVGIIALLILLYLSTGIKTFNLRNKRSYKKELHFNLVILIFGALYFALQIFLLHLNFRQIIRLYGITKTVLALPIVWLCMRNLIANGLGVRAILPIIIIMNYMNFVYMVSGIEILNLFNGSVNYVGAIDLILFPFVMSWDKKISSLQKVLFLISFILIVVFSGSRSVLLVTCIMFIGMLLLEKNYTKKKLFMSIGIFAVVLTAIALIMGNNMVMRAVSSFTNRSDMARNHLSIFADRQYSSYSHINQLLGSGNNLVISQQKPVHNFVWELLLTYGKVGLAIWVIWMIVLAICLLRYRCKEKKRIILVAICWLAINYVQPFMTTGFLFQIVFAISVIQLYLRGRAR